MSYPLLKNYYRKSPMKYGSARYNVIIEDSVQCHFSSRNQCKPLSDTSLFALMPLSSHSRKRKSYYAEKKPLEAHLSIPEEWEGKKQQEKAGVLLRPSSPQLLSSKHLAKQDVPCTPMRDS